LLQVQTRPLWTALHLMPPFSSCQRLGSGKVAEALCGRGLSLPCSTSISQAELEQVVESLATILGAAPQAG
jgi:dTDP-4-amino-4,6-dideoxygalactose transaminase